ncbi:NAD(P)H-dependent oxidoreductase [Pelagimonas varians]|uniref:Glutathione-regulated potassium-efflux system ancillary protein KefF n=1 Tax=Pelagimonas varians TaxID=696760 RepID=A0A238KED6_9RHOB|nr:NAD(P)H-dependent oxidoreductase [Pelagimonas varians]PYG32484.1 NAD(P)H dehydrogenase (quinone) [Pelagimonas varians]SMX41183.1 Glutathione-regulated potassium-efflux system ancillary protein KefF [Pelagimonas varians]
MTTTLIVLAHPDPRSFNGAWADATEQAALDQGDTVLRSNLCKMGFDPVESAAHYPLWSQADAFDPLKAQEQAAAGSGFPADVQGEIEKLRQADRVIFHFPIWWFAPPAVLKGWFDRVLAHGALHTVDRRFDRGLFKGKTAQFCVTAGAGETECGFDGKEGNLEMLLWPTAYTLRYLGFTILKPKAVFGVHGYFEGQARVDLETRLQSVLRDQGPFLKTLDTRPEVAFNKDTDFDAGGKLRADSPSVSHFIRHTK